MIDEINIYEKECITKLQMTISGKEVQKFEQTFQQIEAFHKEWSLYLTNIKYDEEAVIEANQMALKLWHKISQNELKTKSFLFGNKLIEFVKSTMEIDKNIIGSIK